MPTTTAMPHPAGTRTTGLVSVDGRTYPLDSTRLDGRAEGGIAATTLTQIYRNPYPEPLEVLYTLPLPADAAVIGYTIRMGERVIRGRVEPREKAEAEFRRALAQGHTAALLDQDRADTFRQRLGALPPGVDAEISIDLLQPLAFLPAGVFGSGSGSGSGSGAESSPPPRWELRFPTVVGVRYQGRPGRVPDAERLDVDRGDISPDARGTPARLDLNLLLADGAREELAVETASGELVVTPEAAGLRVGLSRPARLDRDLVLRWNAGRTEVGVRAVEGTGLPAPEGDPDATGDTGRYALVTLTPPAMPDRYLPRDLTILIDASGSMQGAPVEQACRLAIDLLRSLDPGDRFEVLAFATDVDRITDGMVEAGPATVQAACRVLERLRASGATEMAGALRKALYPLRDGAQRQVVLLTDGYIGFESEVIGEVLRDLPATSRVHVVGIGSAPNRSLTRGVARAGGGIEAFVGTAADLGLAVDRLRQATARPVLTGVTLSGSALVELDCDRPRDVMAGQPLVATAELRPEGGELELRGELAGGGEEWVERIVIPPLGAGGSTGEGEPETGTPAAAPALRRTEVPLGALHGRARIEEVELRHTVNTDARGELDAEIERLGMRHRIASRRTSLVAVAEEPSVDPRLPRRFEKLAVELPAGVSALGVGLAPEPLRMVAGMVRRGLIAPLAQDKPQDLSHFLEDLGDPEASEESDLDEPIIHRRLRFSPAAPMRTLRIAGARLLQVDDSILILEFTVPHDGFVVPHDRVEVRRSGRRNLRVAVEQDQSSPRGPLDAGLIVRLALRHRRPPGWSPGRIILVWTGNEGGEKVRYELDVELPAPAPEQKA